VLSGSQDGIQPSPALRRQVAIPTTRDKRHASVHGPVWRVQFHLPLGFVASCDRIPAVSKGAAQGKVPALVCASAQTLGLPRGRINADLRSRRPARKLTHL